MVLSLSNFRSLAALPLLLSLMVVGAGLTLGCSSTPRGALDPHLAQAKASAPVGARLFQDQCAVCHGDRGQGLASGPAIMGYRALPEYPDETSAEGNPQLSNPGQVRTQRLTRVPGAASRDPFQTSADVYRYVSTRMPMPSKRAGSLTSEEYWSIVNFMLLSHGVALPEGGVNAENAGRVRLF